MIRATIKLSQSARREKGSLSLFVVIMLKRERKGALRFPQNQLGERGEDKRRVLQKHNFHGSSVSDCLCMHQGIFIVSKEMLMSYTENRSLSFSQSDLYLCSCNPPRQTCSGTLSHNTHTSSLAKD